MARAGRATSLCCGLLVGIAVLGAAPGATAQTVLYLARHGETEGNRKGLLQGRTNSALSELGERQAAALAAYLAAAPRLAAIYASPLGRAQQTAAVVAEATGAPVTTIPELAEADYGWVEGRTEDEPGVEDELARRRADPDYRIEGGESFREHFERVRKALDRIVEAHPNERIAVVAHGGTNRAILLHLLGWGVAERDRLASQPHTRVYVAYRIGPDRVSLLWDDLEPAPGAPAAGGLTRPRGAP